MGTTLYICNCIGITPSMIREAAQSGSYADFTAFSLATGCSLICGVCREEAEALFQQNQKQPVEQKAAK